IARSTLSLHDALPISASTGAGYGHALRASRADRRRCPRPAAGGRAGADRSADHALRYAADCQRLTQKPSQQPSATGRSAPSLPGIFIFSLKLLLLIATFFMLRHDSD